MRSTAGKVASWMATVVLLVAGFSAAGCRSARAAPTVPADGYGFAVGAAAQWLAAQDATNELEVAAMTTATWLRVLIDWSKVEPSKGVYDWEYVDHWIDGAVNRNFHVLGLISYTAAWARPPGTPWSTPPTNPADFAAFAAAVVKRYGDRVAHWEIWNEPNLPIFFGYTDRTAERYTQLLKATYPVIKSVQPHSTVLAAGLSRSPGPEAAPIFLQRMYAAGARGFFDAAAMHPYKFVVDWLPPDQEDGWAVVGRMRNVLAANGDGGKKIWLTEIGAPTSDAPSPGVSQQDQARQIADILAAAAATDYTGPAFIYSIRDIDTKDRDDTEDNFGALVTSDWTPKVTGHLLKR